MIHFYAFDIAHWNHDTRHLTFEQKGIYIDLCHYYLSNLCDPLPLDITAIAKKIAPSIGLYRSKPKIQCVLNEMFIKTNEGYTSTRLQSVLKKAKNNTK